MALLTSLKLVTAQRSSKLSPVQQRRNKLLKSIFEQLQMAGAKESGSSYASTKLKKVTNAETGEQVTVSVPKRVKPWWWIGEGGKTQLSVRYGSRILTLNNKGANAIECPDGDVIKVLEAITKAVQDGELDAAIESATSKNLSV